jgi:hypothetical protein
LSSRRKKTTHGRKEVAATHERKRMQKRGVREEMRRRRGARGGGRSKAGVGWRLSETTKREEYSGDAERGRCLLGFSKGVLCKIGPTSVNSGPREYLF